MVVWVRICAMKSSDLKRSGICGSTGYTQRQIAEYLHVKQNTYSQYEIGVLNYPIDVLMKLADLYQVSVDYLLGRTDETKPYPKK